MFPPFRDGVKHVLHIRAFYAIFPTMIEVRNLTKCYGSVEAVQNVSFSVGREQVLGFLR